MCVIKQNVYPFKKCRFGKCFVLQTTKIFILEKGFFLTTSIIIIFFKLKYLSHKMINININTEHIFRKSDLALITLHFTKSRS